MTCYMPDRLRERSSSRREPARGFGLSYDGVITISHIEHEILRLPACTLWPQHDGVSKADAGFASLHVMASLGDRQEVEGQENHSSPIGAVCRRNLARTLAPPWVAKDKYSTPPCAPYQAVDFLPSSRVPSKPCLLPPAHRTATRLTRRRTAGRTCSQRVRRPRFCVCSARRSSRTSRPCCDIARNHTALTLQRHEQSLVWENSQIA